MVFCGDFLHLMDCCLSAELAEPFLIVHGMSNNSGMRWNWTGLTETLPLAIEALAGGQ